MKNYVEIVDVVARQILDSRCFPTVEVEVYLEDGTRLLYGKRSLKGSGKC